MRVHTSLSQQNLKPEMALQLLKEGNARFTNNLKGNRDLLAQPHDTREGQFPFAAIISCMDSRTSVELIFDQGLGDVFSIRIAGNIINDDILGSVEFATAVIGSKIILVLGHTSCGAIKGAHQNVQLGHLNNLLEKIKPAIEKCDHYTNGVSSFLDNDNLSYANVAHSIEEIVNRSSIIREKLKNKEIAIAGAVYSVNSGKVDFFKEVYT
ncbi:MAG: carbonic anhydrase [Bacteroidetes bacterium]|nr:carbonic anhydrase [Bacteroidota bacterium]